MDDLPQTKAPTNDAGSLSPAMSSGGKEGESIPAPSEFPLKGIGQEMYLPKEVVSAGVSVTPQTVPLPPQLMQAGVQAIGANVPVTVSHTQSIKLPLTDEQISKALQESVKQSIRWLAEWCVKKIKMVHKHVIRK